jgi:predicted SAM-dependent methyltransferase
MYLLIKHFIAGNEPSKVLDNFPPEKQSKIEGHIKELITNKYLVAHEEITDASERISNMVSALRALNVGMQQTYAGEKAEKGNNFLTPEESEIRRKSVISMLQGNGLEIGGVVNGISENVKITKVDISANSDHKDFVQKDATDLSSFSDDSFDFIINSHILEHLANPLKVLMEWKRIVKKGGFIFFVVPNMEFTNDSHRSLTTMEHLIKDYENNTGLHDTTHMREVFSNSNNPWYCMERFQPLQSPYLHQHTWNMKSLLELLGYLKFEIVDAWETGPFNLNLIAKV